MRSYWLTRKWTVKLPQKIIFGLGAVENIVLEVKQLGGNRVLIVADDNIKRTGLLEKVDAPLRNEGFNVEIFFGEPEPRLEVAEAIAKAVRQQKYDTIIGIGGGSNLDLAKIASIMATNQGNVEQYIGMNLVQRPGLPKILIPTTAGTGSEATPNAIVSLSADEIKTGIITPYNFADTVIVDPMLTLTMPPRLTAITGLDALTHAIEAYMSIDSNEITDALALKAIQLISTNLPVAFANGENVEARYHMSLAALIAGIAISHAGTCAGHAAAYAFAVKYKIPHGLSCAIALPYVMEFNAMAQPRKLANISESLCEEISSCNLREKVSMGIHYIVELIRELNLPYRLQDLGVPKNDIPRLAKDMLKSVRLLAHNARRVSEEDAIKIFTKMWEGNLESL
jgi:alcohol dehydrogenase class IV